MADHESSNLAKLTIFLRVYGVITLTLFSTLLAAFVVQTPLLVDPIPGEAVGRFNWVIWNGVVCGAEPCHVPPMLFTIYLVWGVFFVLGSLRLGSICGDRRPQRRRASPGQGDDSGDR
jgi:hypothetical protein